MPPRMLLVILQVCGSAAFFDDDYGWGVSLLQTKVRHNLTRTNRSAELQGEAQKKSLNESQTATPAQSLNDSFTVLESELKSDLLMLEMTNKGNFWKGLWFWIISPIFLCIGMSTCCCACSTAGFLYYEYLKIMEGLEAAGKGYDEEVKKLQETGKSEGEAKKAVLWMVIGQAVKKLGFDVKPAESAPVEGGTK